MAIDNVNTNEPTHSDDTSTEQYTGRSFAINDNRELGSLRMKLRRSGDAVEGLLVDLFKEPAFVTGKVFKVDPRGLHMLLRHGAPGQANQAVLSLVENTLGIAGDRSLVGTFKYTTNGDHDVPSWPIHNCTLVVDLLSGPLGEAPTRSGDTELAKRIQALASAPATEALVIDPAKEYYIVDQSERGAGYLSVEHRGAGEFNWAYRGDVHEHDYCKVKFTNNPLGDFAQMTIASPSGELRTLRANNDVNSWAHIFWGDGSQGPSEPVLTVKAERVGENTFTIYHQRLAEKMWLGFGGRGGNWGVIESKPSDEPLVFTLVEVPPR